MRLLVSAMLVVVAIIHLLPLVGAFGGERLAALYGVQLADQNLLILMRHRAVLFGILGAFIMAAAIVLSLRTIAFIVGFVSVATFLALAWSVGGYNRQIGRVVTADIIALVCLIVGAAALSYLPPDGS